MFPKFKENKNITLNLKSGESRSIPCQASGYPLPAVGWIKNGSPLSNRVTQNSANVEKQGRISNLILTNVSF